MEKTTGLEAQKKAFNGQQIVMLKSALAAEKFEKYITTTPFPKQPSDLWKELALAAIRHAPPLSLRITLKDYVSVVKADINNLTFYQFANLSNAIEVISIEQARMSLELYTQVLEEAVQLIEFYQLEITRIKNKIDLEVEKEVSMKIAAEQGASSLTPVKGEA